MTREIETQLARYADAAQDAAQAAVLARVVRTRRSRTLAVAAAVAVLIGGSIGAAALLRSDDSTPVTASGPLAKGDCVTSRLATTAAPEGWATVTLSLARNGTFVEEEVYRELWGATAGDGIFFGGFPPQLTERAKTLEVPLGAVRYEAPDSGGFGDGSLHGTIDLDPSRPECEIAFSAHGTTEDQLTALLQGLHYAGPDEEASTDGFMFTFWTLREVVVSGERTAASGAIALRVERDRLIAMDGCNALQPAYQRHGDVLQLTNDLSQGCADGPPVSNEWEDVSDTFRDGEVSIELEADSLAIRRGNLELVFQRGKEATPTSVEQPPDSGALLGTWTAQGISLTCSGCTTPTITFLDEERIEVNDSCNEFATTYYFLGKHFYPRSLDGTERSCPPTEAKPPDELPANERVNQLIGTAPALTVTGDTLTLAGNGDRITFVRA